MSAPARDLCRLAPSTVARAEDLARQGRAARRRKPRRGPAAVARQETVQVDARVLSTAKRLAGGDCARLVLRPDGSVIVANRADRKHVFQ